MSDYPDHMLRIDAEQAVIGGLILDPSLIDTIMISPKDFYRPAHQVVFDAIRATVDSTPGRVDQAHILERLTREGDLARVGGGNYLHTCVSQVTTTGSTGFQARIVVEAARLRHMQEISWRMVQACASPDGDDVRDVLAGLAVALEQVVEDRGDAEPIDVHEFGEFVERAEAAQVEMVIPGLLGRMERVIIVASEGAGKTMLSRQIAVCLGQGRHPLRPKIRIPAKRVLMVDLENPPDVIASEGKRVVDAARNVGGGWDAENVWLWSKTAGINLRKPADVALLDRIMAHVRPSLMCIGPLYKAALSGTSDGETVASEVASALDKLREKHRCALWIEAHAPMEQNGARMLRPFGSGLWSRWPEFGRTLQANAADDSGRTFDLGRFRRDRVAGRAWPEGLAWGTEWPFDALWGADGVPFEKLTGGRAA